mmetsp:Transcript_35593/g.79079  ORF Transcript_35593/g.79079 Transcript_35593/m.79079 type:complete len:145 (-) Transcript_35593:422-856(-)|eukprot:CAMPEP_0202900910 /NCGR_PEP_ID=MMETSP1392-20130828/12105_1 /ASSEMBLY_ACC=CAM_ASM_000868 /TAXON_ID=225041 /ORGANISM="Chlamydomonas chlamydogama, Strain SAG 11-48b" /LENGTH=144 /DNA_ID=CAMNT_0049587367 /DNA_START=172 /DNA_END=606 /DNA_ORIENTATION=-
MASLRLSLVASLLSACVCAVLAIDGTHPADYEVKKCYIEESNEYHGHILVWGDKNRVETIDECCKQCRETLGCSAFAYCNKPEGCGKTNDKVHEYKECWLKQARLQYLVEEEIGKAEPGNPWTSGAVYSDLEYEHYDKVLRRRS